MQPIESEISIKVSVTYTYASQKLRDNLEEHLCFLSYSEKIII